MEKGIGVFLEPGNAGSLWEPEEARRHFYPGACRRDPAPQVPW